MAPPITKETLKRSARLRELNARGLGGLFGTNLSSILATDNTVEAILEVSQNKNNPKKFRVLFSVANNRNPIGNTSISFDSSAGGGIMDNVQEVVKNPSTTYLNTIYTNNYYAFFELYTLSEPFNSVSIRNFNFFSTIFYSTTSPPLTIQTYDDTVEAVLEVSKFKYSETRFRVLFSVAGGRDPTKNTSILYSTKNILNDATATLIQLVKTSNSSTNTIYTNSYYAFINIDIPSTDALNGISLGGIIENQYKLFSSIILTPQDIKTYDDTVEAILEVSQNKNNPKKFRVLFSVANNRNPIGNTSISFDSSVGGGTMDNVQEVVKTPITTYLNTIYTNNYYAFFELPYTLPPFNSVSIRNFYFFSTIFYSTTSPPLTITTYDDTVG